MSTFSHDEAVEKAARCLIDDAGLRWSCRDEPTHRAKADRSAFKTRAARVLDAIGYDALVAERDRLLVAAEFVLDKKAAVKRGEGRKADLIGYYFHEPDPIRGLQTAVDFVRIHPQEDADRG